MKRPYNYQYKGKKIGYGVIQRGRSSYRNALRHYRKTKRLYGVGFDYTELWNLDSTFFNYIYKHNIVKSKFLEAIVNFNEDEFVLKQYNLQDPYFEKDKDKKWELYQIRDKYVESEKLKLRTEILEILDKHPEIKTNVCNFIVPRLKCFKDIIHSYPCDMTFESWKQYIQECIDEIENFEVFDKFFNKIYDFWN